METHSFKPIIDGDCTVLILGSMPGIESLRRNEYYGHPRNAFWRLMFDLLGVEPTEDYTAKKRMLLENHVALWDVIESCEREGSLDSAIKEARPNDFKWLFREYPNIKRVYFNGAKAYDTYKRYVGFDDEREYVLLPSTSLAHAVGFKKKLTNWKKIFTMY